MIYQLTLNVQSLISQEANEKADSLAKQGAFHQQLVASLQPFQPSLYNLHSINQRFKKRNEIIPYEVIYSVDYGGVNRDYIRWRWNRITCHFTNSAMDISTNNQITKTSMWENIPSIITNLTTQ